jgi:hypothetical protein
VLGVRSTEQIRLDTGLVLISLAGLRSLRPAAQADAPRSLSPAG